MIDRIIRNKTNLANVEIERAFDPRFINDLVTVRAEFIGCPTEESMKALSRQIVLSGCMAHADAPVEKTVPERVILNDPATVTFYNDGSKVITKAKDGDEYDPLFGLMACALRKVGKNRVRIDSWEHVIEFLAENIGSADECRVLADMLNATADAWELDGVAESMDKWAEEQREEDDEPASTFTVSPEGFCKVVNSEEVQEAVRQAVRDLMDRGEL